jgi:NAD-dependent SIR2 family protein deacetylase
MENYDMEKDDENKLDGNAAAGTLQTIFSFEPTLARVTCKECGSTNPIGETAAYMSRMGTVLRCPTCGNAVIRIVSAKGRSLLDMGGTSVVQINTEGSIP